jgi:hypothetical protein
MIKATSQAARAGGGWKFVRDWWSGGELMIELRSAGRKQAHMLRQICCLVCHMPAV